MGMVVIVVKMVRLYHYKCMDTVLTTIIAYIQWHAAICTPECQNGGEWVQPNQCHCPVDYSGPECQNGILYIA